MTAGSPWFRAANLPSEEPESPQIPGPGPVAPAQPPYEAETAVYEPITAPEAYRPHQAAQGPQEPHGAPYEQPYAQSYETPYEQPYAAANATPSGAAANAAAYEESYEPVSEPAPDPETMALRTVEETAPPAGPLPGPGRAERRRAARRKGRGAAAEPEPAPEAPAVPLSRVEARRAARAAKDSVGVVLSRVVGELFITFGVVMLLFVTYQLWWTNVLAGQETDRAKEKIENSWTQEDDREPGAFEPGEGFAIMYIPKLDVVVPVAEGIDKTKVLDKGMVGHYAEGQLKTAMPADKQGNFAVAGHRNTHGEPFRYVNRLQPGDAIVVETRDAYYTYEMTSILPQTSPSNVSVIDPVPKGSGFTKPGRYITLTTCTPEFTSTYRMIVWGKLVDERPRDKGKPDALVG
ncbi:class E sortase [Streptomyces roseicoloratus]|uniref:class E sortase n=1 Tax=Streptomyces roseicoloratus TaxID=2508722 RepID=UPI001009FDDB|nr:class E sortase [Streptomyces roseicoloratus]